VIQNISVVQKKPHIREEDTSKEKEERRPFTIIKRADQISTKPKKSIATDFPMRGDLMEKKKDFGPDKWKQQGTTHTS